MTFANLHHSFDIGWATSHGIEESLLLHHFQYWIRFNRNLKRNFIEGRTYTYQTYKEIAAVFPYLSYEKVRYAIKKLVQDNVLILGNFNQKKGDNTIWFAFQDEDRFVPKIGDYPPPFHREWEFSQTPVNFPRALPDTKTDIPKKEKETKRKRVVSPKPKAAAFESSRDALDFYSFFEKKNRERNPSMKSPPKEKWLQEIDKILRIDKRTPEQLRRVIDWAFAHEKEFWATNFKSPEQLRKWFDDAWVQLNFKSKEQRDKEEKEKKENVMEENRKWAYSQLRLFEFKADRWMKAYSGFLECKTEGEVLQIPYTESNFKEIIKNKLKNWGYMI